MLQRDKRKSPTVAAVRLCWFCNVSSRVQDINLRLRRPRWRCSVQTNPARLVEMLGVEPRSRKVPLWAFRAFVPIIPMVKMQRGQRERWKEKPNRLAVLQGLFPGHAACLS